MTVYITSIKTWVHKPGIVTCTTGMSNWQATGCIWPIWFLVVTWQFRRGWGSIVGIVTCCRLNGSGSNPGRDRKCPDWLWGLHSLLFSGYKCSFLGVQWSGNEVYHSPPSSAKVKNEWSSISFSHIRLHSLDRENLTFLH
jgi:hypothetical protein